MQLLFISFYLQSSELNDVFNSTRTLSFLFSCLKKLVGGGNSEWEQVRRPKLSKEEKREEREERERERRGKTIKLAP
jgi:hypothetical protein